MTYNIRPCPKILISDISNFLCCEIIWKTSKINLKTIFRLSFFERLCKTNNYTFIYSIYIYVIVYGTKNMSIYTFRYGSNSWSYRIYTIFFVFMLPKWIVVYAYISQVYVLYISIYPTINSCCGLRNNKDLEFCTPKLSVVSSHGDSQVEESCLSIIFHFKKYI